MERFPGGVSSLRAPNPNPKIRFAHGCYEGPGPQATCLSSSPGVQRTSGVGAQQSQSPASSAKRRTSSCLQTLCGALKPVLSPLSATVSASVRPAASARCRRRSLIRDEVYLFKRPDESNKAAQLTGQK